MRNPHRSWFYLNWNLFPNHFNYISHLLATNNFLNFVKIRPSRSNWSSILLYSIQKFFHLHRGHNPIFVLSHLHKSIDQSSWATFASCNITTSPSSSIIASLNLAFFVSTKMKARAYVDHTSQISIFHQPSLSSVFNPSILELQLYIHLPILL